MSKKVVIFDFDGTMADTAPMIRAIYAEMATQNNWRTMTDEDYDRLRRGSLRQARKWAGIHVWQFPIVVHSAKKLMRQEADKVILFPGIVELIRKLSDTGHEVYALSRNSSATLAHVFERYELGNVIEILPRRKRTLGSKTMAIKKLLRRKKYDKKQVWMIGDEVRDVQAAHRAGVQSIAVAWGIQDVSLLKLNHPTHLVESVAELRELLLKEN